MNGVVKGAIELTLVRALEHHRKVLAVLPVCLCSHLLVDPLVETCAGKRVRDGNSDIVRTRPANELNGLFDVCPGFSRITELDEEAGA